MNAWTCRRTRDVARKIFQEADIADIMAYRVVQAFMNDCMRLFYGLGRPNRPKRCLGRRIDVGRRRHCFVKA